jgi:hypothetical protein
VHFVLEHVFQSLTSLKKGKERKGKEKNAQNSGVNQIQSQVISKRFVEQTMAYFLMTCASPVVARMTSATSGKEL